MTRLISESKPYWRWLLALAVVFVAVFSYIFNEKIDLNGDNCTYYTYASALAQGVGYADLSAPGAPKNNAFPPGYPLLMTPLRMVTASFVAQKWLNGLFLLGSALLFFLFLVRQQIDRRLAFIASALTLVSWHVLHFTTMMMSEPSTLFFSVWALWLLSLTREELPCWKDPYFWASLLVLGYLYHIRTQAITIVAAAILFWLVRRRWLHAVVTAVGFALTLLPWMIRNRILEVGQSRYLDMMVLANPWRPEEGAVTFDAFIERFVSTVSMLIGQALPNSIIPFMEVNYQEAPTWTNWCVGLLMVALIVYGFWQLGRYKSFLIAYPVFLFGLIGLWSTPSENRYIVSLEPFLIVGLVLGCYTLLDRAVVKMKFAKRLSPYLMALLFLPCVAPLKQLHAMNSQPFPPPYQSFFGIGEVIKTQLPSGSIVASRKPSLLYMYSEGANLFFPYTSDDRLFLQGLLDGGVTHVVLDELGYSATALYLYPVLQKHPTLFTPICQLGNTYLIAFDRGGAQQTLQTNATSVSSTMQE